MDKNKVSIIIPVYNAEDYLARCLDSILNQDMTSFEVILVDDGSTDASPLICDRYSETDPRFRTIHKPNGGVSSARNAGLNLAKGEYVMFVDSDDALNEGALEAMLSGADGEDLIVGGFVEYLDQIPHRNVQPDITRSYSSESLSEFFEDNIRRNCEMLDAPWAKMFRRKAVADLRFNEALSYAEDKLFVFQFLSKCKSVRTVTARTYLYYLRPGSLGSDRASDKHISQLLCFLPLYSEVLQLLAGRFSASRKVAMLYHRDLVGRYVCRILNIFASRRTTKLTQDNIRNLYQIMASDNCLGIFSLRIGQVLNIILYKVGSPAFTVRVYKFTSWIIRRK